MSRTRRRACGNAATVARVQTRPEKQKATLGAVRRSPLATSRRSPLAAQTQTQRRTRRSLATANTQVLLTRVRAPHCAADKRLWRHEREQTSNGGLMSAAQRRRRLALFS